MRIVSIRTTQNTTIAFPWNKDDSAWVTLSDVDAALAVSVDDADDPEFALVHMLSGDEMRDRFDRAYAASLEAGHSIPIGRGVWLPLYIQEANDPPARVGAGAGLIHPPVARVPFGGDGSSDEAVEPTSYADDGVEAGLTFAEAKRLLALSLGIDPANVKITIEA